MNDAWSDVKLAIKQRDARAILKLFFQPGRPVLMYGYQTENELWDYKKDCPRLGKEYLNSWADLAKEVLAMHNKNGGVLLFGMTNDYSFCGAANRLDSKQLNDGLRRFLSDRIWVDFNREFIQSDQKYLGIAMVPPRGPTFERFHEDAPLINGVRLFEKDGSAIRDRDSSYILTKQETDHLEQTRPEPVVGRMYAIDEPFFRVLQPDYNTFVQRTAPCKAVEDALDDPRVAIVSVVGIGGIGKTALATWAVLNAYGRKQFDFIVSITAKDRELTPTGIRALQPALTSFEGLLDSTLEVLGFSESKALDVAAKEAQVRNLLASNRGLLYIDNLETVDDARVIQFLESLPSGSRAVITSRRTRVRSLVRPVDLGGLDPAEVDEYILSLGKENNLTYVNKLTEAERSRIGDACDRIPLAIRWTLSRSRSAVEAVSNADGLTASQKRGEEMLEYSFRRVFEGMTVQERAVLHVLALFQQPQATEAILVGTKLSQTDAEDALSALLEDALIERQFDPDRNDYVFTLMPVARSFVLSDLSKKLAVADQIRKRLADWYEALDITDPDRRLMVRELRQGVISPEQGLVDLALAAQRQGKLDDASGLFEQALGRAPRSWRAAKCYAEFLRHERGDRTGALRLYERAAANAPRRGAERATIFREYGLLLRDSGAPNATDLAIQAFETTLKETPNDPIAIYGVCAMLDRKGSYARVIELAKPMISSQNPKSKAACLPLLLKAYEHTGQILDAARVRDLLAPDQL